ncbi:hypothetical protein O7626_09115 [Micromonospora sp. WMMD1102]|uniref:hypothetical protein n=1 Tax=Micromonospora sp. WMMD1102 TaxID=3016105 RepID=UPI0024158FB1|nr:hypothetical protein [Micromonospora sp. WMMD1102]MDG4786083.1 hypothetical protein [Micromonospora sp. WMMD1102]
MRSRAGMAVAVAVVLGLVSASGQPVPAFAGPAAPPQPDPVGVTRQDEAQALAADLATLAEERGWTSAQARARHELAEKIRPLHRTLAERLPDTYVGGVLPERPGEAPTFLVKGVAPEFVRTMVAASGLPIRIVDRQPYSAGELADRSRAVHGQLKALGYTSVTTAADITSGQVRATVTAKPGTALRGVPSTSASISAALPASLRAGLDLDVVEGPANQRHTSLFGGMPTTRPGAGLICTTGFSVSPGGFVGVTTAAHCNNSQAVHNGARHPLNLFDEHLGDFGDVEWSTSDVPVTDDFVAGSTETRDVTGVRRLADMLIGDQACVFGQSTGLRRCSFIADLDVSITDRRGTSHRQVAVRDNITQVGDSGGPWFVGTVAYGTHVGNAQVNGATVSAFSVADLFDEALGVRVMR